MYLKRIVVSVTRRDQGWLDRGSCKKVEVAFNERDADQKSDRWDSPFKKKLHSPSRRATGKLDKSRYRGRRLPPRYKIGKHHLFDAEELIELSGRKKDREIVGPLVGEARAKLEEVRAQSKREG